MLLMIICFELLVVLFASPPRSLLPRSASLEPDVPWLHADRLGNRHSRRRAEELTTDNTGPIRIAVDYASLFEESAPPYSACFKEGAWFARGLPDGGLTPPTDGVATCVRGTDEWHTTDCWLRCAPADVITPTGRAIVMQAD